MACGDYAHSGLPGGDLKTSVSRRGRGGAGETMPVPMDNRRPPLPPGVRAILWLDGVLLVAAALALAGMSPALGHGASAWTWMALGGAILTAGLAALSAFELTRPDARRAWFWLPVPAFALWIGASGVGCLSLPQGVDLMGDTPAEAAQCLGFLLGVSAPLLALILFMLWRTPRPLRGRAAAMGALASAGAAGALLTVFHPHDPALLDLAGHATAIALVLAISAGAARFRAT
jgi:hypothetical protein